MLYLAERLILAGPSFPFLVVIITTPLPAREPYIAAADASLSTWIEATSSGLIVVLASDNMPSITYKGEELPKLDTPLTSMVALEPGAPPFRTVTPGTSPWIASPTD